jgi:type IV pilus assembly protein PilM
VYIIYVMPSFLNSLKSLVVSKNNILGVDIGTTSIKIVELADVKGKPVLKNYGALESYGHLERVNTSIQTSTLKMLDKETSDFLNALLEKLKITTRDAAASLPSFSAFTSLLDVPVMPPQEMDQAMQYQARAFVPLPISEVSIDWLPVGEYEDDKGVKHQQIFLASVPNEQVRKYQRIFKTAGLNLKALEIEGLSLARILTTGDPTTTLIVDIGSRSTALAIAEKGFLKYNAQTDWGGSSITQSIAASLGVNAKRAEEVKKQNGLLGSDGERELSTLMMPMLDVILNEVRRFKDNYEKNYHGKVERIILSGGGSILPGLEKYVSEQFKMPAVKADPFSKVVYPVEAEPIIKEVGPSFSVALGLAIRQFI